MYTRLLVSQLLDLILLTTVMGPPKCPPALDRSAERDGSHILSRAPRGCGQFGLCPFAHALDLQGSGILVPLMAARRGCWSGPRHEETSSGRDTRSGSTFRSSSNLGSLLGCRDASACCCSETARLHRCRLRWARSSTPRAPRSRDIPWQTLFILPTFANSVRTASAE